MTKIDCVETIPTLDSYQQGEWQRKHTRDKVGLIFLGATFALALLVFVGNVTLEGPTSLKVIFSGVSLLTFLLCGLIAVQDYRRLASIPAAEKEWWHGYKAILPRIEQFNSRLQALQAYARSVDEQDRPGPEVAEQYDAERKELMILLQPYVRMEKFLQLQAILQKNDDPRYRVTRDVSDLVYTNMRREAEEEAVMIAAQEPIDEEFVPVTEKKQRA